MKKERKPKSFIYKPYYEGGTVALKEFVSKNLKYPTEAISEQIKGVVKLKYDIDYKGKVVGVKVIKGLGHGCDEEAIRIVKKLKFKVRKPRKGKIIYHKTINIHFHPPKKLLEKNPKSTQFNYNFTPKTKAKRQKSQGYTFTIKIESK